MDIVDWYTEVFKMSLFNKSSRKNGNPEEVLSTIDKRVHDSKDVLTRLWRVILIDIRMSPMPFYNLLDKFLEKVNMSAREKMTERGNLKKLLFKDNMTMNTFLKALVVISVKSIKITIDLEMENGKKTSHSVSADNLASLLRDRKPRRKL